VHFFFFLPSILGTLNSQHLPLGGLLSNSVIKSFSFLQIDSSLSIGLSPFPLEMILGPSYRAAVLSFPELLLFDENFFSPKPPPTPILIRSRLLPIAFFP